MRKRDDLDLDFFRKLLEEEKASIEAVIRGNEKEIEELKKEEGNTLDEADEAFVNSDSMIRSVITAQQLKELEEVNRALIKIENGTYGICEMCEEDIAIERLKVKPHARYCIICRGIVEEKNERR